MNFWDLNSTMNDGGLREGCRVYHDAAQSLENAVTTVLSFNSERYDPYGMHDTSTNNSRITARSTGIYLLGANIAIESMTGIVQVQLYHSGGNVIAINKLYISASVPRCNVNTVYRLQKDEYVTVRVVQSSGGTLDCTVSAGNSPEFWAQRVR